MYRVQLIYAVDLFESWGVSLGTKSSYSECKKVLTEYQNALVSQLSPDMKASSVFWQ